MLKQIKISGIEDNLAKGHIIILENTGETYRNGDAKQNKYKIWAKDRQGNPSEAYQQFQQLRPMLGDTVSVDIWEKEESFINQEGKVINFTSRTINRFTSEATGGAPRPVSPQGNTSVAQEQENAVSGQILANMEERIKAGFKARDERIEKLEKELAKLGGLVKELSGADAYDLHMSDMPIITEKEDFSAKASEILGL